MLCSEARGGIVEFKPIIEICLKKYSVLIEVNGEKINNEVLDYVAEPIEAEGNLYKYLNRNCLYINTHNINRLRN